ncbi:MAG: 50S ribosomal protein L1 [archaeon]
MEVKEIVESVKAARDGAKKRGFIQSFDLALNLKGLDLKKPEGKIKEEVVLPHGRGKNITVAAFVEGEVAESAKKAGIETLINKAKLSELGANKKEAKKLCSNFDFLIAQPDLMAEVGKNLGAILAPRGKMPKPVPPKGDLKPVLERLKRLVNLQNKGQPVVHCLVGIETMEDMQIAQNIEAVYNAVTKKLPRGDANIKSAHVKLTMGHAARIGGETAMSKAGAEESKTINHELPTTNSKKDGDLK